MDLKKILTTPHYRTVTLKREDVNAENRTAAMSFSSETPIPRWWGIEVLSHDPSAIRMDRANMGLPFLMDHDPTDQRGRIEECRCDPDKVFRGTVRFSRSERGQELMMDLSDGIRMETSMGYAIHKARELKPEEMTQEMKDLALREAVPVYFIEDWEPLEGSSVAMPADISVGVGRDMNYYDKLPAALGAEDGNRKNNEHQIITHERGIPMPEPKTKEQLDREEQDRVAAIRASAEKYKSRIKGGESAMTELVNSAIDLHMELDRFRGEVFTRVNDTKALETPDSHLDLSEAEKKRYSLRRAILSQVPESRVDAGFERECSEAIATRSGKRPRGLYVPYDIQTYAREIPVGVMTDLQRVLDRAGVKMMARDLTVGSATAGGNLVGTNLMSFIELLRNKLVSARVGVGVLSGLQGNVAIPKQTGAGTFGWVAENVAPSETALTIGQVTLAPKTGAAYMDFSRQLLLQSTPAIDGLVQNDLARIAALGVDLAVFHGTGASNQPTGIALTSGIGAVDGSGGYGWPQAVEHESDVEGANADAATMYFVTRPSIKGELKTRPKETGYPVYLINETNEMNGYPVISSSQIAAAHIFFGDFSQAMIGEWGSLDILVDPYTGSTAGTIRVTSFISVDVAVRQAGAFSVCSNFA